MARVELPQARVVKHAPWPEPDKDPPRLGEPPRPIPRGLWLQIALGSKVMRIGWVIFGAIGWVIAIAVLQTKGPVPPGDATMGWILVPSALAACLPVFVIGIWRAYRDLQMLRYGLETRGKLKHKREVEHGDSTAWHYVFEYAIEGGAKRTATIITTAPEPRLEDESLEPMVYDSRGKREAITLDNLPGYPTIQNGRLVARDRALWLAVLLPPVALLPVVWLLLR